MNYAKWVLIRRENRSWRINKMTILQKIDNIESAIFEYEIANVTNNIINVFTEIIDFNLIDKNDPNLLLQLNVLMGDCLAAMKNKDYLLLADRLEYQLKPILQR